MTEPDAREILSWRYHAPYDFYNPSDADPEKGLQDLVEPTNFYLAVRDGDDSLIGYYCFGGEARVSGGDYADDALDISGGSRPDLLGTGIGDIFVQAAMDFGKMFFHPQKFRATLPVFNTRALRICKKAGFEPAETFSDADGQEFVILIKDAELEQSASGLSKPEAA